MSQEVALEVVVVGMAGLLQAIAEAGLECIEAKQFQTGKGKHAVDLVVTDEAGTQVGIQVDSKTQKATFITHGDAARRGTALAHRIAQRYAYARVVEELRRKGYRIGTEQKQPDGSIKLVAQRWK